MCLHAQMPKYTGYMLLAHNSSSPVAFHLMLYSLYSCELVYIHARHHTKGMKIRTQVLALFSAVEPSYRNNHLEWLFRKRYPGPISAYCVGKFRGL